MWCDEVWAFMRALPRIGICSRCQSHCCKVLRPTSTGSAGMSRCAFARQRARCQPSSVVSMRTSRDGVAALVVSSASVIHGEARDVLERTGVERERGGASRAAGAVVMNA